MKYPVSAARIAEAIEERGLTQRQLEIQTGISHASISQYKNGQHRPRQEQAVIMARVLGVSPSWLMGYDADKYNARTPVKREYKNTSTPEEFKRIIVKYRALDARGRDIVETVLDTEYKRTIPTDADVLALLQYFRGTPMEAAIYLSAFGTLRRGEICALTWDDVQGDVLHVSRALVRDEHGKTVAKAPKTARGDRYVTMPPGVMDRIREICPGSPLVSIPLNEVTKQFGKAVKRLNLPAMRFHDLRHYSAAVMHFLGVPEHYAMNRGGWENKQTMTEIYEGVLSDKENAITAHLNGYFSRIFEDVQHDMQHAADMGGNENGRKK